MIKFAFSNWNRGSLFSFKGSIREEEEGEPKMAHEYLITPWLNGGVTGATVLAKATKLNVNMMTLIDAQVTIPVKICMFYKKLILQHLHQ